MVILCKDLVSVGYLRYAACYTWSLGQSWVAYWVLEIGQLAKWWKETVRRDLDFNRTGTALNFTAVRRKLHATRRMNEAS